MKYKRGRQMRGTSDTSLTTSQSRTLLMATYILQYWRHSRYLRTVFLLTPGCMHV